jgi:hypothetical protein
VPDLISALGCRSEGAEGFRPVLAAAATDHGGGRPELAGGHTVGRSRPLFGVRLALEERGDDDELI